MRRCLALFLALTLGLQTNSLFLSATPAAYAAPATSIVTAAETVNSDALETDPALEVYRQWMESGGGENAALPEKIMIEMYKAAGNDGHAFKHIAKLIAEGHILDNHSVDMAKQRDAWVEKLLFQMAKEKGYEIGRSDSGNQASGMKSDLDQTIYVFKVEDGVPVRLDVEADEVFIKEFSDRWTQVSGGIELDALDLASIAGGNRFPDGRDQTITEYFKEFERTTKQLRDTPGAYTYQGAVLQQMQFRALDAILKENPRAFRIYSPDGTRGPPDDSADWSEEQWDEWRRRAIKDMFGIEPQLMKGHAFGAAVANWYELQKYLNIKKKFESKYHLRTWEDAMFVMLISSAEEGRTSKREYLDLDGPKKDRYNKLIMQRLFPHDSVTQRKHTLAMEVSSDLRRLHKAKSNADLAKIPSFNGQAITDPKAQKRALLSRLAVELYAEKVGYDRTKEYSPDEIKAFMKKLSDADIRRAEQAHRHVASEFCLESVYHTSIDAFELLVDPRKTETFIRKFNHLQQKHRNREAIDAEAAKAQADLDQAHADIKKHQAVYEEARKKLKQGGKKKTAEVRKLRNERNKAKFHLTQAQNRARESEKLLSSTGREKSELEIFNRLTREFDAEVTEANRGQFLKRLADGVHISLIHAIYDLGETRGGELIRRLNEKFPGHELRITEILKASKQIGVDSPAADPNNALKEKNLSRIETEVPDVPAEGSDKKTPATESEGIMTRLRNHVRDYVYNELKIGPEKERALDLAVRDQTLVWHWRDYAHDKFNDAGSLDTLGQILLGIVEQDGDLADMPALILEQLSTELPVYGQLVSVAEGGVSGAATLLLAMIAEPVGQMMLVYSLGSTAYAIYDLEFGAPSRGNSEDAVYRGFYGPELFNYESNMIIPFPDEYDQELKRVIEEIRAVDNEWHIHGSKDLAEHERRLKDSDDLKEKDPQAWRVLFTETRMLRLKRMERDQKMAELELKRLQLENLKKQSEQFLKDRNVWHWQGGSYTQKFLLGVEDILSYAGIDAQGLAANAPGAQLEQKPFSLYILKEVTPMTGFFQTEEGYVDFEAKDESEKVPALEEKRDNSLDIEEKLTIDAEIQEIRLQAARAARAEKYLEAAQKNPELMYKIKRDSLYPYMLKNAVNDPNLLLGEKFAAAWLEKNKSALVDLLVEKDLMSLPPGIKKEGDKFIRQYREEGVLKEVETTVNFPFAESFKERLVADYARSKQMWDEKEKREDERRRAAKQNLAKAVEFFKVQAVGMLAEKEAENPAARDFYNALIYSAVQRSKPKVKADVGFYESEGENAGGEKKFDVGVLVNITADPTVYRPPYEIKVHHLNKEEAGKALQAKKIADIPLDQEVLEKLAPAVEQAGDDTLISVVSVFASSVLDASEIIFPETLSGPVQAPAAKKEGAKAGKKPAGGFGSMVEGMVSDLMQRSAPLGSPVVPASIQRLMGQDIAMNRAETSSAPVSGELVLEKGMPFDGTLHGGMPDTLASGRFLFTSEAFKNIQTGTQLFYQLLWAPKKDGPWNPVNENWQADSLSVNPGTGNYSIGGYLSLPDNDGDGDGKEDNIMSDERTGRISISSGKILPEQWPKDQGPYFRIREAARKTGAGAPKKDDEWTAVSNILEPEYDLLFANTYPMAASYYPGGKIPDEIDMSTGAVEIYDEAGGSWPGHFYGSKGFNLTFGAANMPVIVEPDGPATVTSSAGTLNFWMNRWIQKEWSNDAEKLGPGFDTVGVIPVMIPKILPGQSETVTVSVPFRKKTHTKTFTVHGPRADARAQAEMSAIAAEYAILSEALNYPQPKFADEAGYRAHRKQVETRYYEVSKAFDKDPAANAAAFIEAYKAMAQSEAEWTSQLKWNNKKKTDAALKTLEDELAWKQKGNYPQDQLETLRKRIESEKRAYEALVAGRRLGILLGLANIQAALGHFNQAVSHYEAFKSELNTYRSQKIFSEYTAEQKARSASPVRAGSVKFDHVGRASPYSLLRHLGTSMISPRYWQEAMQLVKQEKADDDYFQKNPEKIFDPQDYVTLAQLTAIRYGDRAQATAFYNKAVEIEAARRKDKNGKDITKTAYAQVPGWILKENNFKSRDVTEGIELTPEMKVKDDWIQKLGDTQPVSSAVKPVSPQAPSVKTEKPAAPSAKKPAAKTPPATAAPAALNLTTGAAFRASGAAAADEAMMRRDYPSAHSQYTAHLAEHPDDTAAAMNLAKINLISDNPDAAVQGLMKAMKGAKGAGALELKYQLIQTFFGKHDWQNAQSWNDKILNENPEDARALSFRGTIFNGKQMDQRVVESVFQASTALDPAMGDKRFDEGMFLYNNGNFGRAYLDFLAAYFHNKQDIEAVYWMARCYARVGWPQQAVQNYQAYLAIEKDPVLRSRAQTEMNAVSMGGTPGPYFNPPPQGSGGFGANAINLSRALSKQNHLSPAEGALVIAVVPGSPSAEAGLKPGDIITKVNGERMLNAEVISGFISTFPPSAELTVDVVRSGQPLTLTVTLS